MADISVDFREPRLLRISFFKADLGRSNTTPKTLDRSKFKVDLFEFLKTPWGEYNNGGQA